jgi:mono/diheme cytochrome c family protein
MISFRSMHCAGWIFAALSVTSALAADADNGERLARRWCASCHVIAPDQRSASEAPPFATVARRPDFSTHALAFYLLHPHPKMPDMGLSRSAAEDLAAYIATLK